MQSPTRNSYLETEVMTATPQKLQYMLIEAAIRNLARGKHLRSEGCHEQCCEALIRAQQIVTQILAGLNREVDADLAKKVAAIYMFIFRSINEAQVSRDNSKLDDCIRVLEIERDTWRRVCEQLEQEKPSENEAARTTLSSYTSTPQPVPAAPAGRMPALDLSSDFAGEDGISTGFSIEA